VGLYGVLFSAGKSIFLFFPPLILGVWARTRFRKLLPDDALLFGSVFLCQLFFYARWWDWSGDNGWGVRFFLLSTVLMTLPLAALLNRKLVIASIILGFAVQLPAVVLSGLDYLLVVHGGYIHRPVDGAPGENTVDIEDVRFNPRYSQIAMQYSMVLASVHDDRSSSSLPGPGPRSDENAITHNTNRHCSWDFWWCR
jgi:hypothetical protein